MALWNNDELNQALMGVRNENAVDIVIRRQGDDLAAQTVRIARMGGAAQLVGGEAEASEIRVIVLGDRNFDVSPGDKFTHGGELYEVDAVRPNRLAAVEAEARMLH